MFSNLRIDSGPCMAINAPSGLNSDIVILFLERLKFNYSMSDSFLAALITRSMLSSFVSKIP